MRPKVEINRVVTQCRFEASLYAKLKIIADRERRPSNSQIEYYIAKGIQEYEREHGPIEIPENDE